MILHASVPCAIIPAMSKHPKHPLPPTAPEPPKSPITPLEDEDAATTKKPGGPPDTEE